MNTEALTFIAQLRVEQDRLGVLENALRRKRQAVREALTLLHLGVDPELVGADLCRAIRRELAEIDALEGEE
jgi:hypothetical protein